MKSEMIDLFIYFVSERYHIYQRRAKGEKPPFTTDPILRQYKFTNIHRELDRTSIWVANNIREPLQGDLDCWIALAISVFVNKPETLSELSPLLPYDEPRFLDVCRKRMASGEQVYSGAYIIRSYNNVDRAEYIFSKVLRHIWVDRERLHWSNFKTLSDWWTELTSYHGMGSFLAAQTIASTKYLPEFIDRDFPDWWTFAKSGPGSRRGLNRILGLPVECPWNEDLWFQKLNELRDQTSHIPIIFGLHNQDLQNCLCEFDKYCRAKFGEGRPKSLFTPGRSLP